MWETLVKNWNNYEESYIVNSYTSSVGLWRLC